MFSLRGIAAVVSVTTCSAAFGQASLPPTAPTHTSSVSDLPSARPAAASNGGSSVTWNGSTLTVVAGGDSLRSVLGKVARATGMRVTGGVPEERIFGNYGPGPAQVVLGQLFDGMNVNMLLINGSPSKPKELVLTARTGGVTPPSSQPLSDAEASPDGQSPGFQPQNQYGGAGAPSAIQGPPRQFPQSNGPGTASGVVDSPNNAPATDANGTPQSPNGTRTPEQIFDELRRRQQSPQQ